MSGPRKRTAGRPAGSDNTRDAILATARESFGRHGYAGASLRAIAASAGVDPSTLLHFFGTKEGLYRSVVGDMTNAVAPVVDALRSRATGEELVKVYLGLWTDEETEAAMRAITRTAFGSDEAMAVFGETLTRILLDAALPASKSRLDAELLLMQLVALGIGRNIARLPELSEADIAEIARRYGPGLDPYLVPQR